MKRRIRAALVVVAFLFFAAALPAEEFEVRFDNACAGLPLAKIDLNLEWIQDGAVISEPSGVTLTVHTGDRTYTLSGLPDVAAGSGTRFSVTFQACGSVGVYAWPQQTRTPQSVVFRGTFRPRQAEIRRGDTLPALSLEVTGLGSDPTGSTVTFSMAEDPEDLVPIVNAGPAVLSNIDQAADGSWNTTATYNWSASDTTQAGRFSAWFTITFPVADCGPAANEPCISTWPPDRNISVRIH